MKEDKASLPAQYRIYRTMKNVGILNLVFGILSVIAGVGIGVICIVNGARLLVSKSKIII